MNWSLVGSLQGASPKASVGDGDAVIATSGSFSQVLTLQISTATPSVSSLPSTLNATPVILANGNIGVAASLPNGSLAFFTSEQGNGAPYFASAWLTHFSRSSSSSLFDSIGQTLLSAPGGVAGQIAAASQGTNVFILFTTEDEGSVSASALVSSNNGTSWLGPYLASGRMGSVEDPSLAISPVGYVYGTWLDDMGSEAQVDQAVFDLNGKTVESPLPLPSPLGVRECWGGVPSMTIDQLERPVFVWTNSTSRGTQIVEDSAFLSTTNALHQVDEAVQQLVPSDFSNQTTANSSKIAVEQEIGSLINETTLSGFHAVSPSVLLNQVETRLYPSLTSVPLTLVCGGNDSQDHSKSACQPPHRGLSPHVIANLTGPLVPNKYLAVYLDWVIESLGQEVAAPAPADPVFTSYLVSTAINPVFVNPITLEFQISTAWSDETGVLGGYPTPAYQCFPGGPIVRPMMQGYLYPFVWYVTLEAQEVASGTALIGGSQEWGSSTNSGQWDLYLTGFQYSPQDSISWSISQTALYDPYAYYIDPCNGQSIEDIEPSMPTGVQWGVDGNDMSTPAFALTSQDAMPTINVIAGSPDSSMSVHWNTTMPATTSLSVEDSNLNNYPVQNPESGYVSQFDEYVSPVPDGGTFTDTWQATSEVGCIPGASGCYLPAQADELNIYPTSNGYGDSSYPAQSLGGPIPLTISSTPTTANSLSVYDVTPTSATAQWGATQAGSGTPGFLDYFESGTFSTGPIGVEGGCTQNRLNPVCVYLYQLQGLVPLTQYTVDAGIEIQETNYNLISALTTTFITTGSLTLQETDLPYDSISERGGGANVQFGTWSVPLGASAGALPAFNSGYIVYTPTSGSAPVGHISINYLPAVPQFAGEYQLNLSTLVPNTNYALLLTLNCSTSTGAPFVLTNSPFSFTYLADTSGDGLTNVEKALGWAVPFTNVNGVEPNPLSDGYANVNDYATNGLTNDFIEKEFSLNPQSLDTAGSGMLDTWNMTFDLGPASDAALSIPGFQIWYEDSSLDPFDACPAPNMPMAQCNFMPHLNSEPANISTANGADDGVWASEQLWSNSALYELQNLIINDHEAPLGWLRAVTGTYKNGAIDERTLTVWGKLSWGANPLAASTPEDGIADGARVNPIHHEDLQIEASAGPTDCASDSPIPAGSGTAVRYYVNDSTGVEYNAYSSQGLFDGNDCPQDNGDIVDWYATLPVDNTFQYHTLAVQLVANPPPPNSFGQLVIGTNGCQLSITATMDLLDYVAADIQGTPPANGCMGHTPGNMNVYVTVVPVQTKVPTYLWVPSDNSTLSNLPTGLQRYIGEPDFGLIAVNLQVPVGASETGLTSDPVADPWGAPGFQNTYSVALQPGLNDFLVPRAQLLSSIFGQSILLGTEPSTGSTLTTPLLSASEGGSAIGMGGSATEGQLACYWQNRALQSPLSGSMPPISSSDTTCSPETGLVESSANPNPMDVVVEGDPATAGSCSYPNCGEVTVDPDLEAGTQAPAISAIMTLNITCDYVSCSAPQLDALLAGLLNNPSGGNDGYLENVAAAITTLALPAVVTNALSNIYLPNGGAFGVPAYQNIPPPPSLIAGAWAALWNAVSGVASLAGALIDTAWSATLATIAYFNHLAAGVAALAEQITAATVSGLYAVGAAIESAIQAVIIAIEKAAASFLTSVWETAVSAVTSYASGVDTTFSTMLTDLAVAAVTNPSPQATSQVLVDSVDFFLSLIGAEDLGKALSEGMSVLSTIVQPILSLVSLSSIMSYVMGVLTSAGSPLHHDFSGFESAFQGAGSVVGSSLVSVFSGLGFGIAIPSGLPSWMYTIGINPSAVGTFVAAVLPAAVQGFVTGFFNALSNGVGLVGFILTIAAAVALVVSLAGGLGKSNQLLLNVMAIILTVIAIIQTGFGGVANDVLAIIVDVLSISVDTLSLAGVGFTGDLLADNPASLIADLIDVVADGFDANLSLCDLTTGSPSGCL